MSENTNGSPKRRPPATAWKPGKSANPGGRPRAEGEIRALAQQHGPAAIATLAQCLRSRNERVRVAAASVLLDRGYGRTPLTISGTDGTSLTIMHLTATIEAGQQILSELAMRQHRQAADGQTNGKIIEVQPASLNELSTPASE